MTYSLVLLTVGLMPGQGCQTCAAAAAQTEVLQAQYTESAPDSRPRLFGRLRHLLHRDGSDNGSSGAPSYQMVQPVQGRLQPQPVGTTVAPVYPVVQPGEVIRIDSQPATPGRMPAMPTSNEPPLSAAPMPVQPMSYQQEPVVSVQKEYQDKVGAADDYSWITGQLGRVHTAAGAVWVVRYNSVGQADKYGGSVVLAPAVEMRNYREGDLVCVQGEILQDRGAPGHLGGALYRASSIAMVSRAD